MFLACSWNFSKSQPRRLIRSYKKGCYKRTVYLVTFEGEPKLTRKTVELEKSEGKIAVFNREKEMQRKQLLVSIELSEVQEIEGSR